MFGLDAAVKLQGGKDASGKGGAKDKDDAIVVKEDVDNPVDWWGKFTAARRTCEPRSARAAGGRGGWGCARLHGWAFAMRAGGLLRLPLRAAPSCACQNAIAALPEPKRTLSPQPQLPTTAATTWS